MTDRRAGALHVVVAGVDHFVAVGTAVRAVAGLLDEPGGEDRRREREQPDTEDSDDGAQQFPERGDGVDIAVADSRQRRDPPPVIAGIEENVSGWARCSTKYIMLEATTRSSPFAETARTSSSRFVRRTRPNARIDSE